MYQQEEQIRSGHTFKHTAKNPAKGLTTYADRNAWRLIFTITFSSSSWRIICRSYVCVCGGGGGGELLERCTD